MGDSSSGSSTSTRNTLRAHDVLLQLFDGVLGNAGPDLGRGDALFQPLQGPAWPGHPWRAAIEAGRGLVYFLSPLAVMVPMPDTERCTFGLPK